MKARGVLWAPAAFITVAAWGHPATLVALAAFVLGCCVVARRGLR